MDPNAFAEWPRLELQDAKGQTETYVLDLFPTSVALDWQQRLANLGLEQLMMMLSERELPWHSATEADLAVIARTFLAKMNAEGLQNFMRSVTAGVYLLKINPNGGAAPVPLKHDFDLRFRGRTLALYRIVMWVLIENFRDFGSAVPLLAGALRSRFRNASPEPEGAAESSPTTPSQPSHSNAPSSPTSPPIELDG